MGKVTHQSDPMDDLYGLLRNPRRRLVIHHLHTHTETDPINVGTLAAAIASRETDGQHPWRARDTSTAGRRHPTDAGGEAERDVAERVEMSLFHTHLPKLHERGIVEFDSENRTVKAAHSSDEFWDCQRLNTERAAVMHSSTAHRNGLHTE